MAANVKASSKALPSKHYYYPKKPPSTPSPTSKRKADGKKNERGADSRRTRSYELDRSSKHKLVNSKNAGVCSQDDNGDCNVRNIKSKVLEELKQQEIDGSMWRRRGFSYPSEHGEIPAHSLDIIKKETKLVILEYLSSLPSDKIRARNKDVAKAKTIHITTDRPALKQRKRSSLYRSSSDAGEHFEEARRKFREMALPLKRQLSTNVLEEIEKFDKHSLKAKKKLALNLAKTKPPSPGLQPRVLSPESIVVQRLEDLSDSIMHDFPQLLDEPITNILTPLDDGNTLTYETFAVVAKAVFEKNLARFSGTLWSRIALVLYLAREIVYFGNLNDTQMELLVEYSSKFVTENSHNFIKKQGGWGALELEDDILVANGSLFDPSDFEHSTTFTRQDEVSYDELDGGIREKQRTATTFVNKWMSYGIAAAAIGLGVAYGLMKHI